MANDIVKSMAIIPVHRFRASGRVGAKFAIRIQDYAQSGVVERLGQGNLRKNSQAWLQVATKGLNARARVPDTR
jgi:hypothetical protein